MITLVAFAFAISFSTVKCDLWHRVNYPQPVEMEYSETVLRNNLGSCVAWCARRQDTLGVSYQTKDCFCFIRNSVSAGTVNVSFVFLKYYDYANCFDSGYNIIYPHLNFCMKFYSTEVKWHTANQTCINDGARLMTLETDAKCNIATFLPPNDFADKIHVGGSRNGSHFVWNTGVEIQNCWSKDEPSSNLNQKCVTVFTSGGIYMHDMLCHFTKSFLCEKPTGVTV